MADKVTHVSKIPTFEDFKAPWETDAGEVEIVKPTLKKYVYNLVLDAAKRADRAEEAEAKVSDAEKAVTAAKAELAANDSTGKIATLEADLAKVTGERDTAVVDKLRLEVGTEKGLTPKQAARLTGATKEELEADADDILETFGVKKASEKDDEEDEDPDDDEATNPLRRAPLVNPAGGRAGGDDGDNVDFAKVVAGWDKNPF